MYGYSEGKELFRRSLEIWKPSMEDMVARKGI